MTLSRRRTTCPKKETVASRLQPQRTWSVCSLLSIPDLRCSLPRGLSNPDFCLNRGINTVYSTVLLCYVLAPKSIPTPTNEKYESPLPSSPVVQQPIESSPSQTSFNSRPLCRFFFNVFLSCPPYS